MSKRLEIRHCIPCEGGLPPLGADDARRMLAAVPGWELDELCTRLRRTFRFTSFALAQAFAVRVGEIVEAENHHPDICYGWGYCAITLYTHKIGGLHDNDFIIAAKVNSLNAAA